jgi:hypothetical protein
MNGASTGNNIKVAVRVRPPLPGELNSNTFEKLVVDKADCCIRYTFVKLIDFVVPGTIGQGNRKIPNLTWFLTKIPRSKPSLQTVECQTLCGRSLT